jgi:phage terminase large subunit-like protein
MKYHFDEHAADRAVAFIETMITHCKGEWTGQPFILEKWQKEQIIRPIFGWKREDGTRKYRTVYIEIPRKNGKSNICAALGIYMLFADSERGAEIYSAAADTGQAKIVFDIAKQMVAQNPELSKRAKIYQNSIVNPAKGNFYKAISSDSKTKHGFNSSTIIIDELHTQPNRELWDTLTTSTGARREPLTVAISTAGYDKNSICWEVHDYATKVRDKIIKDETFLPILYAADEGDDFTLEETWKKANPGYGTIIKKEYLEKEAARAKEIPSYTNSFKRLHLNQWTTNQTLWIGDELWMTNNKGPLDLNSLKGQPCYAGLDLASIRDLTALVLVFPRENEHLDILPFFFTPKDTAFIRSRRDKVDYITWANEGHMELTPGNVTDYGYIKKKIYEIAETYDLKKIAYDRWNSSQLILDVYEEGIPCEPFGQGFVSMSQPCKEIERLTLEEKINHAGHPVLRWNMTNLQMKQDPANNIKMDKAKSTEKIDGAVAMAMAIGAMMNDDKEEDSTYNDNDIIFI